MPEVFVTEAGDSSDKANKEKADQKRKADLAAARRAKILSQMSRMQKTFISENREMFDATHTELTPCPSQADIRRFVFFH